jgi:DNA segregation ATPase FtsK/SpoIIIE, S-DNA-T family
MGKNTAVRSQMDIRICLRVREPRDADLILGQGMVNSGWHAHKLSQPGEFLISDPGHAMPERNRAYLLTDALRDYHAARCATGRPELAASQPGTPPTAPQPPQTAPQAPARVAGSPRPEEALWAALSAAGPQGVPVADLARAAGKGRTWVYDRLRQWAAAGRVVQTIRGQWRATGPHDGQATP